MKKRIYYLPIIAFVIILGLLSRKIDFVPFIVGDLLYAVMIYFIVRFLFVKSSVLKIAFSALIICFSIEFLQLCQADWLVEIRSSTLGHLVLGQGFLWSDLLAYSFGICISCFFEKLILNKK